MPHDSNTMPESTYPPLEAPSFESQIPEHLLADASPSEKHIMSQLSILTQFSVWSINAHISTNEAVRRTNGRLIRAEEDIKQLKSDEKTLKVGWKVIAKIGALTVGAITLAATIWSALHSGG